ncbi:MAG: hypothetical protein ACR2P1_24100 [Pseudomonadales bacterium]
MTRSAIPLDERAKIIHCAIPDNGLDNRLLRVLREQFDVLRAQSGSFLSVGALHATKAKRGKLPAADIVRVVSVICTEAQADEIFSFLFKEAQLDKPGHGIIFQGSLGAASVFSLPEGLPEEAV